MVPNLASLMSSAFPNQCAKAVSLPAIRGGNSFAHAHIRMCSLSIAVILLLRGRKMVVGKSHLLVSTQPPWGTKCLATLSE